MMTKSTMLKALAAATLAVTSGAAHCAFTIYTSQAHFLDALGTAGTDGFDDLAFDDFTPGPLARHAGIHDYQVDVGPGSNLFYGAGSVADPALSTNQARDTVTFHQFSAGVSAIGGLFFTTNLAGAVVPGALTLVATDSLGATSTLVIDARADGFLGFISSGELIDLTVTALQPDAGFVWPTIDDLVLASAVPEAESYAMMLAGLGALGWLARRRRN